MLGKSPAWQDAGGACSGYLVEDGTTRLWMDAGGGTMANLQEHICSYDELDAIVLSHEHPDHWSDVEGFHVACRYGEPARDRVPIYAPAGLEERMSTDTEPVFAWHTVTDGDAVVVGGLRLRFSATDHSGETLAVRVDGDERAVGYSADTSPAWSLEALGPGLDFALCEATYLKDDEGKAQHMSARQAGASGREAGVHRLVLTHVWPTIDTGLTREEGSDAFGREVDLAAMHDEYTA